MSSSAEHLVDATAPSADRAARTTGVFEAEVHEITDGGALLPAGSVVTYPAGHKACIPIAEREAHALLTAAKHHGVPLTALLGAAWSVAAARYLRADRARFWSRIEIEANLDAATSVRKLVSDIAAAQRVDAGRTPPPDGMVIRLTAAPSPALEAEFSTGRHTIIDVRRLLGHLRRLLSEIAAGISAPDTAVGDLEMLTEAEAAEVKVAGTGPTPDWPNATLHGLVFAQAQRMPEAEAIREGGRSVSYRQLCAWSAALAERLQVLGTARDEPVAIHAERSIEAIVAQLGVMAAQATFLPIDPSDPESRRGGILSDAGCRTVVVARTGDVAAVPAGYRIVAAADFENAARGPLPLRIPPETDDNTLAYVMYTSGSTGTPKGVMLDHRAIVNFIRHAADDYRLGLGDRLLQFAPLQFDTSLEEIYCALSRGACLALREPRSLQSLPGFLDYCRDARITVLDLPTSFWHELVLVIAAGEPLPENVRLVIIGGSAAHAEAVRTWHRLVGHRVRLVNTYGPTETAVTVVMGDLDDNAGRQHVSIGRPISHTRIVVLDIHGRTAPVGVPGELIVTGRNVAHGYLGRPELTAERFPENVSGEVGRRFVTRDLVVRESDGRLTYHGRLDRQLKINGYRVEPDEIEAVFSAHAYVTAAAIVRGHGDGLVAYVVPAVGAPADQAELLRVLNAHLRCRLPRWMVPSRIEFRDRIPLNDRGKADHGVLTGSRP